MELTLPKKIKHSENIKINANQIVVIGPNGAGKSRFGKDIENILNPNSTRKNPHLNLNKKQEKTNGTKVYRISAQKILSFPSEINSTALELAEEEYHQALPRALTRYRNTELANDYEKLLILLQSEAFEKMYQAKNNNEVCQNTKIDLVKTMWEEILPHRKLTIRAGIIESSPTNNLEEHYNAKELSDGEKAIFYLLGKTISANENAVIIIDEPELHIHKSLINKLFDVIENQRTDYTFIYLTHDIDFATSRQEAKKIWVKSFDGEAWDYEILENNDIPEQLYLELLGSRKPILFIEGSKDGIDERILESVFYDEYYVKPLGSCNKVISTTKSFNEQNAFHHIKAVGLIDRDRRTDEEITHLPTNIWISTVAEIENFLLLENIVKQVAIATMHEESEIISIIEEVKNNIIVFFNSQKEEQALMHVKHQTEKRLKYLVNNSTKTIESFSDNLSTSFANFDVKQPYDEILAKFQKLIDDRDYNEILKAFNDKGLQATSKVAKLCGLDPKNNTYVNFVIRLLKRNDEISEIIKKEIKKYIDFR